MRRPTALLLALLALGFGACGGDNEEAQDAAEPVESAPELTVPGDAESLGGTDTTDTTGTGTETAPAEEGTETTAPPAEEAPAEDSPENDTPPPPGSPAEQFEEFCDENPAAC